MELNGRQKRHLRKRAHSLKPVVFIGQRGLTDRVMGNIEESLTAHELIKVKFVDHKDEKVSMGEEIVRNTGAEIAGKIGHILILFRPREKPEERKITLPE